jgi:hypothetical protein
MVVAVTSTAQSVCRPAQGLQSTRVSNVRMVAYLILPWSTYIATSMNTARPIQIAGLSMKMFRIQSARSGCTQEMHDYSITLTPNEGRNCHRLSYRYDER